MIVQKQNQRQSQLTVKGIKTSFRFLKIKDQALMGKASLKLTTKGGPSLFLKGVNLAATAKGRVV